MSGGTEHFWHQRISALALVPLGLWFAFAAASLAGAGHAATIEFLSRPLNALLMIAFIAAALYHAKLGVQVVIEDYVPRLGQRTALLALNVFFHAGVALAAILAMMAMAL